MWSFQLSRENEAPHGRFATGIIAKTYRQVIVIVSSMWYVKHKVGKKTTLKILGILTTFGLCYNEKPITMWGSSGWQRVVIWQIEIGLTLTTGDQWPGLLKSRNSHDKVTGVGGIGGGHLWVDKTHPGALDSGQELVCSHTLTARSYSDNKRSLFVSVLYLSFYFYLSLFLLTILIGLEILVDLSDLLLQLVTSDSVIHASSLKVTVWQHKICLCHIHQVVRHLKIQLLCLCNICQIATYLIVQLLCLLGLDGLVDMSHVLLTLVTSVSVMFATARLRLGFLSCTTATCSLVEIYLTGLSEPLTHSEDRFCAETFTVAHMSHIWYLILKPDIIGFKTLLHHCLTWQGIPLNLSFFAEVSLYSSWPFALEETDETSLYHTG